MGNKWHYRFLDLTMHTARWSKDEVKVGAVVVDKDNRIISNGFNGLPKGIPDDTEIYAENTRIVLHAEVNAILFANKDLAGCTMYVSMPTCALCAAMIIQSGITTVVYEDSVLEGKWHDHQLAAESLYRQAGVKLIKLRKQS